MTQYPTERPAQCSPYLFYDDVAGAVGFLIRTFGFTERFVDRDATGKASHAQLTYGSAVIMLGETGAHQGYVPRRSPKTSGSLNAGIYLFVEDVDAHARRSREAGATIVMEPADMHWGDRLYCAEDAEQQFWMFAAPKK